MGGASAGSVSTEATEIFQEGIQFPFVKLFEQSQPNRVLIEMIRANVRLPESTLGDMYAGIAAARVGAKRFNELVTRYGLSAVVTAMSRMLDYGERMMKEALSRLPPGVYEAEDIVEHDGIGNGPFRVARSGRCECPGHCRGLYGHGSPGRRPDQLFLFRSGYGRPLRTGCHVGPGDVGEWRQFSLAGCHLPLRHICLGGIAGAGIRLLRGLGGGDRRDVEGARPRGAPEPAGGTHAQRLRHVHLRPSPENGRALCPFRAARRGWGGSNDCDGDSGQFSCGNGDTFNIPVELFESRYGLKVEQYAFHNENGGAGRFRGGKGVVLDYRVLANEVFVTYAASRCTEPPWPLEGGQAGSLNRLEIIRRDGSTETHLMCTRLRVEPGELIRLVTATGGGFGNPRDRSPLAIADDLRNGFITPEQAHADYGLNE